MSMNRSKDNGSAKQKVTLVAVVIVCLIIIWQLYSIFGGGSGSSAPQPAATPSANVNTMSANNPSTTGAPAAAQSSQQLTQAHVDNFAQNNELLRMAKQNEPKYVAALSELAMLKVQLEIAQTNQSITNAKLGTVTTEQNIADLLTKATAPAANTQGNEGSPFSSTMLSVSHGDNGNGVPVTKPTIKHDMNILNYSIVAIRYQNAKWHAVLSYNNQFYPVTVGDTLIDQSMVVGINQESVIVRHGDMQRTFQMTNKI